MFVFVGDTLSLAHLLRILLGIGHSNSLLCQALALCVVSE